MLPLSEYISTLSIWKIKKEDEKGVKGFFIKCLKILLLCISHFLKKDIDRLASALTFYVIIAIIPMLSFMVAIAKLFEIDKDLFVYLTDSFNVAPQWVDAIQSLITNYLDAAKGGVILGIGVVFLLYSLISTFTSIEQTFNNIWGITNGRDFINRYTNYFTLFVTITIIIIISYGIEEFAEQSNYGIVHAILYFKGFISAWGLLSLVYIVMPNTRVKYRNAIIAGLIAAIIFICFRWVFIEIISKLSSYEKVYGGLAAIPLTLFFIKWTWTITLLGGELSFSITTLRQHEFAYDIDNMSMTNRNMATFYIAAIIYHNHKYVKGNAQHLNTEEISMTYNLPIRLVASCTKELQKYKIINMLSDDLKYQPAEDTDNVTVARFFDMLRGSEESGYSIKGLHSDKAIEIYKDRIIRMKEIHNDILIRDLV